MDCGWWCDDVAVVMDVKDEDVDFELKGIGVDGCCTDASCGVAGAVVVIPVEGVVDCMHEGNL